MDKIDLDAIISQMLRINVFSNNSLVREEVKRGMGEAIHQALVLASENAKVISHMQVDRILQPSYEVFEVDKQSILDIEKFIV